jgi:hypothetical protein
VYEQYTPVDITPQRKEDVTMINEGKPVKVIKISYKEYFDLDAEVVNVAYEAENIVSSIALIHNFFLDWIEDIEADRGEVDSDMRFAQLCAFEGRIAKMMPLLDILESYADNSLYKIEKLHCAIDAMNANRDAA